MQKKVYIFPLLNFLFFTAQVVYFTLGSDIVRICQFSTMMGNKISLFNPIALRKAKIVYERPKLYTILAFLSAIGI